MAEQWRTLVSTAFESDANLQKRILDAAIKYKGELPALFADVATHLLSRTPPQTAQEVIAKKRKLEPNSAIYQPPVSEGNATGSAGAGACVYFECKDVSCQVPARKKLTMKVVGDGSDKNRRFICLVDPKTNATECSVADRQIDQIFCLPVPEKQQRQWNICVFALSQPDPGPEFLCEQIVWTLNETKPVNATASDRTATEDDSYITFTEPALNQLLSPYGKRVITPSESEFASSIPQSNRKGEKAYHVRAHRGTKEGYLFFLSIGVVFGFKKPLAFFAFSSIESVSYTSVLQRTFNLVIAAIEGTNGEVKEMEFSMLDQADFAGIDDYIKRHGLNDASMAAQRKAKAYNVNKEAKAGTNGPHPADAAEEDEGEESELQKAEQQLQDEEDELEEDYEASGGESDGEGGDSEEEEGDGEEDVDGYGEEDDDEVE